MDNKNWNMDEKTEKIYRNLCNQIEKVFRHTRQGSIKTRYRYMDGVKHFTKFLAENFKKQNLNKIKAKHLIEYVEQMQEWGYSKSYITTNLSAIRYFIDVNEGDGDTFRKYQDYRDELVKSYARSIKYYNKEIAKLEKRMKKIISKLDYKLESMPGIATVIASQLIAQIGDINNFKNADKLAKYAGIAPTRFSSAGKGKDVKGKQGNRTLNGILYFLAMQQIQLTKGTKQPRNPILYEYYQRKISEGKTKTQALICIMRRLVNILYGMMKNKSEYVMQYKAERDKIKMVV